MFNFMVNSVASKNMIKPRYRNSILRKNGLSIKEATIKDSCYFNSKKISIGNSFVNRECRFYSSKDNYEGGNIIIGDNVSLGFNVTLCCISHIIGDETNRAIGHVDKDIRIDNGSWIGANAIILPGVHIGKGCIIGAGAVVTKDCEPNGVYVGNPAKRIKSLD